jgi:cobalt/nickel transport system ATP-binding protein
MAAANRPYWLILDGLIYPTVGESYAFENKVTKEIFNTIKDNAFRSYFWTRVGLAFQKSDVQLFSPTVVEEIAFGPCSSQDQLFDI